MLTHPPDDELEKIQVAKFEDDNFICCINIAILRYLHFQTQTWRPGGERRVSPSVSVTEDEGYHGQAEAGGGGCRCRDEAR